VGLDREDQVRVQVERLRFPREFVQTDHRFLVIGRDAQNLRL
jgi:hypothetical protein